jgi:hypothetical protein
MPAPIPARDRSVYFVGAGLSVAMGLPNTAMLLDGVLELARRTPRWRNEGLEDRLDRAFKYFYPDAIHAGYRPEVVDFFSALRTYLDVGAGLPGGFAEAPHLYRSLKSAIAHLLIEKLRQANKGLKAGHPYLDEILRPGNFVVTSNWDLLIERYAQLHSVPLRHSGSGSPDEVVLLKLHGSIDWCLGQHMAPRPVSNYAMLNERLFATRQYRPSLPAKSKRTNLCVRIRAIESWSSALSLVRSRASEPHIATMAHGKAGELGPLRPLWRDAYGAISRAARLEVVGYSMPPDDIEIRTLLRAGVERGADLDEVVVRNPTPDVHDRIRRYLDRNVESDYRGINSL